ncbi:GntR family transcriptional regulator [Pseudobutyrivibrio xylanivorans]|uniref:GntR family transcriptional regulator n=2 Tax=Pseudobutyrivibrio xylanivorans TaxID=185007 RepID=A0A5P6VQ13_PSEXY|nr:GntR family transcriptional regulator [Pseudobutyrivibrio xylanivorans]
MRYYAKIIRDNVETLWSGGNNFMIPKYISLKEKINEDILSEKYPIGSKLPTEIQLSEQYNVSRSTVRQTLEILENEGIISKRWGSGNTVIAKSDLSKKTIVRILIPDSNNGMYAAAIDDITSVLLKDGLQVELFETKGHFALEREYLKEMLKDMYGGLFILPVHSSIPSTNSDLLQILLKRQLPIIFLENADTRIYNPIIVNTDDYSKGYQMARSLINSGHKKLGGVFNHDSASSVNAFTGFVDAIRDANLEIIDECFLWVDSGDSRPINRFLKTAYNTVSSVYLDDVSRGTDGTFPVSTCTLALSKSLGKEAAKAFLALKKNGNSHSITIPYKN